VGAAGATDRDGEATALGADAQRGAMGAADADVCAAGGAADATTNVGAAVAAHRHGEATALGADAQRGAMGAAGADVRAAAGAAHHHAAGRARAGALRTGWKELDGEVLEEKLSHWHVLLQEGVEAQD